MKPKCIRGYRRKNHKNSTRVTVMQALGPILRTLSKLDLMDNYPPSGFYAEAIVLTCKHCGYCRIHRA